VDAFRTVLDHEVPLRTLLSLPGISLIYILPLIASEDLQIPLTGSQLYLLLNHYRIFYGVIAVNSKQVLLV
jgi:hypothetical protein